VVEAIRDRRRELRDRDRNRNRRALQPGTTVRPVERIRPTSMIGPTATVGKVDRTRVQLDCRRLALPALQGRIRCPLDLVEPVDGDDK
jgi:hypothetical protein